MERAYRGDESTIMRICLIILSLALVSSASLAAPEIVAAPENTDAAAVELRAGEEILVELHQHEMLYRRQLYREASMKATERMARYQRDLKKAKADKMSLQATLAKVEKEKEPNLDSLERALAGIRAADRAITICTEAIVVVDAAKGQLDKHRALIERSRVRLRKKMGAEPDQCGLHKVKMDLVRVPVVKPIEEDNPGAAMVKRLRAFPMPAEPFQTDEAGQARAPKQLVIPACPRCTAALQAAKP